MKPTAQQSKQIYKLCSYDTRLKEQLVQQITGDPAKVSTADLTPTQAQELINSLCKNWAAFVKENGQHKYILSLLIQIGWKKQHDTYGIVADLERFSSWLKSMRSPVVKPLLSMTKEETTKIIHALEGVLKASVK